MRQRIGHGVINVSRRLFAGSFVQRWGFTSVVYMKVFDAMYGKKDTVVQFRGAQFVMPTKDITLTPSVMSGVFERHELDIFERACSAGATIVDVGANIGLYSVLAAQRVGTSGIVYAFEPVSENIALLRQNLELNGVADRVAVQEVAVGEADGELEIFLSDRQIGTHSAAKASAEKASAGKGASVKVPMRSVDAFVASSGISRIDVVKVDVEGYDGQVLQGALQTLRRHKPVLFIEYSPALLEACGQNPDEFVALMGGIYKHCILVDAFKDRVAVIALPDLSKMNIVSHVNLIFAEDISRFGIPDGANAP
jgi:FkbM family methyltransferase